MGLKFWNLKQKNWLSCSWLSLQMCSFVLLIICFTEMKPENSAGCSFCSFCSFCFQQLKGIWFLLGFFRGVAVSVPAAWPPASLASFYLFFLFAALSLPHVALSGWGPRSARWGLSCRRSWLHDGISEQRSDSAKQQVGLQQPDEAAPCQRGLLREERCIDWCASFTEGDVHESPSSWDMQRAREEALLNIWLLSLQQRTRLSRKIQNK